VVFPPIVLLSPSFKPQILATSISALNGTSYALSVREAHFLYCASARGSLSLNGPSQIYSMGDGSDDFGNRFFVR
jgi:hypothetical protein